jgi:predicted O-methyltransferase YrrM
MNKECWTAVDDYYQNLIVKPDPRFERILSDSRKAGLPAIQVTPNQGAFLELLVRVMRAQRVLEIGTLGGYSTAWLAKGLPPEGKLITLELNPDHAQTALKNLAQFEFAKQIDIKIGNALLSLQMLVQLGEEPFDLIFIDADKRQYSAYLEWSLQLSRSGTLLIADNVVRGGKIIEEHNQETSMVGIRQFNQNISINPQLRAAVLQTVGAKGYDGFTFLVVDPDKNNIIPDS